MIIQKGKISLGVPVLTLGYAALVRQQIAVLALPYMKAFTERHGMGTSLAIHSGLDMVYIQRTHGPFVHLNDPVGARRSIRTAPTGWACLAAYGEQERAEVTAALEKENRALWVAAEQNLQKAFSDYRRFGFVLSIGVLDPHFNAVSTPIQSDDGSLTYGISASGLAELWPRRRLIEIGAELKLLASRFVTVISHSESS